MTNLITEARELCEKATEGPWNWISDDPEFLTLGTSGAEQEFHVLSSWKCKSCQESGLNCLWPEKQDASFIARSRTLIPELCDALEKATQNNDELIRELAQLACESVERDKTLARLEAEVMAARDSMCWIPVTEGLPKTEKPVQVYMPKLHMSVQTGFYTKYYGEDDGEWYEHWVASGDVTHWRPLPAPPEK